MEGETISFAIKHNCPEPEWCDRMPGQENPSAMPFDRVESLVETALRVQVQQRSTLGGSGVRILQEAAADEAIGMRQHSHRDAGSSLFLLQIRPQNSSIEAKRPIEIPDGNVKPNHLMLRRRRGGPLCEAGFKLQSGLQL